MRARDYVLLPILLLSAGFFLWKGLNPSRPSTQQPITHVAAKPTSQVVTTVIEDVKVGQRMVGSNPLREQVETWEPDAQTWKELRFRMRKPSGASLWITLIRPGWWVESEKAGVGEVINLELAEMGALGPAEVTYLGPCPEITEGGDGPIVTGTFKHEVDENSNVISLRLEGQSEPTGVTDNHPYWSVDRGEFVPAGDLRVGETVNTVQGTTRVASAERMAYTGFLYNLETTEHVYRVGELGTLVHNECALERFGSKLEAERSVARGGLDVDPRFNGKVKNVAEQGAIDPKKLGPKNKDQFGHKITFELKDGARDWLRQRGVEPPLGHTGSYEIPAHLVDEFNEKFVTGVTAGPR